MELALSLGGDPSRPFTFLNRKTTSTSPTTTTTTTTGSGVGVGGGRSTNGIGGNSCMGLGLGLCGKSSPAVDVEEERESDTSHSNNSEELDHGNKEINRGKEDTDDDDDYEEEEDDGEKRDCCSSSSEQHHNSVVQLNLLPFDRVSRCPSHQRSKSNHHQVGRLRFPWVVSAENVSSEPGSSDFFARFPEPINRVGPLDYTAATGDDRQSSPNSAAASPSVEFSLYPSSSTTAAGISFVNNNKRPRSITIPSSVDGMLMISNNTTNAATLPVEGCSDPTRSGSRGSDDDENGSTRKKLRLSKEQSAFLEESFKEHHTLNPKQKQALAKQLNLRPRQVEVWFQNRRARTKLKQTEVDCEYLKRWCETLTEENKRLQKEVHELRALNKTSSQPFYMNLPPTTLTMCPSCERVATTGSGINNNINNPVSVSSAVVTVAAVPTSQINLNTVAAAATTTLSSSATPPTTDLTLAKPTSSPPQMQAQTQGSGPEG